MTSSPVQIGIIGCGNVSVQYLKNFSHLPDVQVSAVADLMPERAQVQAEAYAVPRVLSPEALLADPDIELVLNLTVPKAHAAVNLAAVTTGKHVYSEKPLGITREDGQRLLAAAAAHGVLVGCAPDTVLGGGHQTCRQLLDEGAIGTPVAATAFMLGHGPESWHPNPTFYYQPGGGPMFDMGPYYLSALVTLLGPVARVTGMARASFPERTIGSGELAGTRLPVQVPTHVVGVLQFAAGPLATLVTSFDVWAAQVPRMEIYGSEGTLVVPDPNYFAGPVLLRRAGETEWREAPLTHPYTENYRGLGVADMARALRRGGPGHRANGEMAYHVLDVMHTIHEAAAAGSQQEVMSTCERPAPFPAGMTEGELL